MYITNIITATLAWWALDSVKKPYSFTDRKKDGVSQKNVDLSAKKKQ